MSLQGFKKNINKANQFFVEKVSGVKGSEKELDFKEMEKKVDACNHLFTDLSTKTIEYLQPNPTIRAKITLISTGGKLQGKQKNFRSPVYPQTEGQLANCMIKYGEELGDDSTFGSSLVATGEAYRQIADSKYNLENNVKQHFLEPLKNIQSREIKDINHTRKKLESRRLDFDCKKRKNDKKQDSTPEHAQEAKAAETKYEETKEQAECRMISFLESETEHVAALSAFVSAELEHHQQAIDILIKLSESLDLKKQEAQSRPRTDMTQRIKKNSTWSSAGDDHSNSSTPTSPTGPSFNMKMKRESNNHSKILPTARALFEFVPESEVELGFDEGDIIKLIEQVDENWFFGEFKGKEGHFPVDYVEVLVPL